MKLLYTLLFMLAVTGIARSQCDTDASLNSINDPFCCHELNLSHSTLLPFVGIRLSSSGAVEFDQITTDPNWVHNNPGDPDEVIWIYNGGGFIPNNAIPGSFCLEQYGAAPQSILVEWLDINGNVVCDNTVNAECPRCISIDQDGLSCAAGGYLFDFDFTNVFDEPITRLDVLPLNITPNSVLPPFIDFSSSPVQPGATSTGHSILFGLPVTSGIFEFVLLATCPSACECVSDTLRLEIPECGCDPCDEVRVNLLPNDPDNEYCCWTLDILNVCDSNYFSGVKIDIAPNAIFRSQAATNGWIMQNPTPQSAIWKPLSFINNGIIPAGNSIGHIEFCLGRINNPSDVPQSLTVSFLDATEQIVCDTQLTTFCEPTVPGDCVIVQSDTLICLNDAPLTFEYQWSLQNVGNFTANFIDIYNITGPGSVNFIPGTSISTPSFDPGDILSSPTDLPFGILTGFVPGDQFCFQISMRDSLVGGVQRCCHTDFICRTIPECPPETSPCDELCEGTYYQVESGSDTTYCCHSLEAAVVCDSFGSIFTGIKLEALNGVFFDQISVPLPYALHNLSPSEKIIRPTTFYPGYPYLQPHDTLRTIDFCLGGINTPTQVPQTIILHWLDTAGMSICQDTLTFDCPPLPEGDCVIVLNDTIKCDPPGHYAFCFDIVNVGMFTGQYLRIDNFHTKPSGGVFNPPIIDTAFTFSVGDTFSVPPIHLNGSAPGDTLCYTISIFDDPDPSTGYNNCCHTDTLCIVLPDCGDETICDSVSWSATSISDDCCFSLEINNNYSSTYFEKLKITALNPGVSVSTASTYTDWVVSPCPGGYEITYTGVGAPFIPSGTHMPIDFCVSGYTTAPQTLELSWIKRSNNDEFIVECCQPFITTCEPPAPSLPCFSLSELSSTCSNDSIYLHFTLSNLTNLGSTAPGYAINRFDFSPILPTSAQFIPDPMPIVPPLNAGSSRQFTVVMTGVGQGQPVHFSGGVHLVSDSTINCCVSDSMYCFVAAECDTNYSFPCDTIVSDSLPYEGWAVVTCGPTSNNPLAEPVMAILDITNHQNAPIDSDWGQASNAPTMIKGIGTNQWNYQNLGRIFGLATDLENSRVFASATSNYQVGGAHWGSAGRPAIYKIDLITGAMSPLIISTNTSTSSAPAFNYIPNSINPTTGRAPAFGNIAYNPHDAILYAANIEDGTIYAIDATSGSILAGFDPWNADGSIAGAAAIGEQVYAVQYHQQQNKLYFSRVNDSRPSPVAGVQQEVWSVDLSTSGTFTSTYQLEFAIPDYAPIVIPYSYPVADIAFSLNGDRMLLAERGHAHQARMLEYRWNGSTWVAEPVLKYRIGKWNNNQDNSAGGTDFAYTRPKQPDVDCRTMDLDSIALCTGNALQFGDPDYIYGLQGTTIQGGTPDNSWLIDFDGNISEFISKNDIGDVEVMRNMCCGGPAPTCCQDSIGFYTNLVPATTITANTGRSATVDNSIADECHLFYISWGDGSMDGPIAGDQLPVNHMYTTMDTAYQICVLIEEINENGAPCYQGEKCEVINYSATNEWNQLEAIELFPNPTQGIVTIKSAANQLISKAFIYNQFGKLVLSKASAGSINTIDLSGLSDGVYTLTMYDQFGNKGVYRVIKL